MTKNPTVAITGATGFVGSTLAKYFAQKGWRVLGLVRHAERYTSTKDITYAEYDLAKPLAADLLKDVTYVVHTAYLKYDKRAPDALEVNVQAAKRLIDAAKKYNVAKMVFMSSMSAHEEALSVYGKQKLAIEKLFTARGDVSLRAGLIVGNGGIVKQMAAFMKSKHAVPLIGGGVQPLQIIAVYDLARVIEKSLTSSVKGVLTVANPTVYSYKKFYQTLADHLKTKVIFVPLPFNLLLAAMRTIAFLRLPLSAGEDNLWGLKALRAVDTAPDLKQLGLSLDDLPKALKNTSSI